MRAFLEANPDIDVFEVCLPDLAGKLRGKWITRDKIEKVVMDGMKLPLSALAFDTWGRDVEAWVFASGDGDGLCDTEIGTLATVPWSDHPTGQILTSLHQVDGTNCGYDPRTLLKAIQQRLAEHGLTPVVASEMEFYLLKNEWDELGRPIHTQTDLIGGALNSGNTYSIDAMNDMAGFMHAVRDACATQSLPIDTLIKESAPSQYEINLYHSDDALRAADQAILLQRAIRGVARQQGFQATFMAKPFGHLAGNGMHIHCSLVNSDGVNVFSSGSNGGTPLLREAIAGCLDAMKACMLIFAPSLNSYRRFQRGTHAPLAPCWGYENRTVSLRVPADVPNATRIEHRVAGADANPYLTIAAILAGILHGIENKLEPAPPLEGNAYDKLPASLPREWATALTRFEDSPFIAEYFGEEFQRVYKLMKLQEMDEFLGQVTPLEYEAAL